ncbi:hypothetical protein [Nostoc sp. 'Lobaria pulmonaria (5183) cyanobiont']|uniref:hypothetical protein n=1 Tax=Nostoc sp. 'Lobaria pulmonaria (5183) cyanobiont' TaxID=1618022 RepID=UPI000CF33150|nr:hypothetical protein [Nostoc sp. 'Lobaria pulmonaria (5183) cyanobiont']AVH69000.1 hypothetical protein NLP_0044 [Nostoc sp. 'Lobaria pulmonaria (5183) cyanobiont']
MNAKIIALLGITAAFATLGTQVYAQSPASNSNPGQYRLTGDSLVGIARKTAQNDFKSFFEQTNPASISNNRRDNKTPAQIRFNESLSQPDTSVFLTPAQSGNDNDGLQVQLDIRRE